MGRFSQTVTPELVLVTTGVATALGALWYYYNKKNPVPKKWEPVGKVKSLYIYPLKSGHRIELTNAICSKYGMKMPRTGPTYQFTDRNLLIYKGDDHEFRTARQYPRMIFIKVTPIDEQRFTLSAPEMPTITVDIPADKAKDTEIILHKGERIFSRDCGDDVARWISKYILDEESGLRIGFHDGQHRRNIHKTHKKYLETYPLLGNEATGMYSDFSSFMVMNQASVDELKGRIPESNISVLNFRPNILVEGDQLVPFAEDDWKWLKVGDAVFYIARHCTRCIFTTIDPDTGVKSDSQEPLKTMRTYRLLKDVKKIEVDGNLPVMGVNMGLHNEGEISVGDTVYVGKY